MLRATENQDERIARLLGAVDPRGPDARSLWLQYATILRDPGPDKSERLQEICQRLSIDLERVQLHMNVLATEAALNRELAGRDDAEAELRAINERIAAERRAFSEIHYAHDNLVIALMDRSSLAFTRVTTLVHRAAEASALSICFPELHGHFPASDETWEHARHSLPAELRNMIVQPQRPPAKPR